MRKPSIVIVLLGVLALLATTTTPSASAQQFRLVWHDSHTGITQHDKHWTSNIVSLAGRQATMNFRFETVRAWIEKRRSILGIIPLRPTTKIETPGKNSGRLR